MRARTFRSLRRHRNYRIFFSGQLVSLAGTWMQNVALAWLVIELSGSPLAIGALAFWRFVPFTIFGLVAGVVADRIDSRKLVMATQAAAMVISIALAVVTLTDTATLPIVYVLAALGGVALAFDAPGRQSLTFQMVGPRELPNAVALNSGLFNGSRVIGPAIAGLVIAAVGTGACFVLNAVSFLAVLTALAIRSRGRAPSGREGPRRDHHRWTAPSVRRTHGTTRSCDSSSASSPSSRPSASTSTSSCRCSRPTRCTWGPRASASCPPPSGPARSSARSPRRRSAAASWRLFAIGAASFGVLAIALAPVQNAYLAGFVLFGIGIAFTLFTANANALVQLAAPDHLRGRLIGLYLFAFLGLAPVGGLLAGSLADVGGTGLAFAVAGVTSLATIGVANALRSRAIEPAVSHAG